MSNLLTRILKKENKPQEIEKRSVIDQWQNPILGTLNLLNSNSYAESKALKLSAVYRAVTIISESVAILPLDNYIYKDNWKYKQYNQLYYLMNVAPNQLMSAFTFKKQLVQNVLLKGNAFVFIKRDQSFNPIRLDLLNSDNIKVLLNDNQTLTYKDQLTGQLYSSDEIIHIMNHSINGLLGISTLSFASLTLETAYNSEQHASNFFSGGGALAGILRPLAGVNLTKDKATSAKQSFVNALDNSLTNGKSNSIVVLDSGLEYQAISINPKDSQLLESRQFNFISIAQYFGVPLSKLFDKTNSSYASSEAEQIDFLNSTLLPLLEKIEIEFYRKLFLKVDYDLTELKFDTSNLLRLDASTQASVFSQLFNVGAMTTNEIREKLNSNFPVKGGNRAFVQQNVQPIDNLLNDIKNSDKSTISGNTITEDIQKQALNGAQITSLIEIVNNISSGILSKESAKQIISAAFPSFTTEQINGIVDSIKVQSIKNITNTNTNQ
jgi:HK97 family phage portal protein